MLATNMDPRKVACQKAKDLKTNDPADLAKCFAYSTASITDCRSEGVDLTRVSKSQPISYGMIV